MAKEVKGNKRQYLFLFFAVCAFPFILKAYNHLSNRNKVREIMNMSLERRREYISTPEEFIWYHRNCLSFDLTSPYFVKSPEKTNEDGTADCADASVAAFYYLEDDGFKGTFVLMRRKNDRLSEDMFGYPSKGYARGHLLFYYEKYYGIMGRIIKKYASLGGFNTQEYSTIDNLVKSEGYDEYILLEFDKKKFENWSSSEENFLNVFRIVSEKWKSVR